jgi:glycosyltransferase involved in cell wall biosynthesis
MAVSLMGEPDSMRIAIDATPTAVFAGGIPVYTRNLIRALSKIDKENDYILFYSLRGEMKAQPVYVPQSNFSLSVERFPVRIKRFLMRHTPFSYSHFIGKVDLLHTTDFKGLKVSRGERWVATVYDLIVPFFPEFIHEYTIKKVKDYVENYLPEADYIITISECSKRDIINTLNWPEDRIEVTYIGVDFRLRPGTKQKAEKILGFSEPYILAVSTLEPRKNYPRLFRAFDLLRSIYAKPLKLVVIGKLGWLYDDIFLTHQKCRFKDDIVILNDITTTQLGIIFSGAEFYVHPSLYEGFGLPVLEAQYMGKAVLAGNNSSIPEVVGDSALLVDVKDEEEILKGMLALLENPDLRNRLIKRGYDNVKRFSWEKTARETLAVYQRVFNMKKK